MAASSSSTRSLVCAAKRLRITPPRPSTSLQSKRRNQTQALPENVATELSQLRLPRAVQATYLAPLKRQAAHRIPTCDLQLRSYSVRNLEVFTDFALRAAYYLHLPASGPVPLPRIIERWTVPRSNFIFKKSQQNFERITLRRLIQIQDGHPDVVKVWLDFLQKYHYFGVGMKANLWDYSGLNVAEDMLNEAKELADPSGELAKKMDLLVADKKVWGNKEETLHKLFEAPFKAQWGAAAPMSANEAVAPATKTIRREKVVTEDSEDVFGGRRTPRNAAERKGKQP